MSVERKKILVVDDSETFVMYICIILKRLGFQVIPADNGLEAMRLLKLTTPDLILLDVNMPMLDGVSMLKHVKEDAALADIPVVMMTVDSAPETMERCRELGCADYLTKPVNIDALHNVLEEHIYSRIGWVRKHMRVNLNRKVSVYHDGTHHELYTEAISEGGMYLRKKDPFPVGSEVKVTLPIGDGKALCLNGSVIYLKGLYGREFTIPPGMAIKFRGLTGDDSRELADLVSRLLADDVIDSQEETVITITEDEKLPE